MGGGGGGGGIQVGIPTIVPQGSVMRTGTVRGTPGLTHVCHYPDLDWKMVDRNAKRVSRHSYAVAKRFVC